ncbi:MAG: hypothetical protein N2C13_04185 [Chloroflexota bacterium]
MEDKITIIEGPAPTFERVVDDWAIGIAESPTPGNVMMTRLRTFNGPALVERCHRAWRERQAIHLEYRGMDSINREAMIVAARSKDSDDGQLLILWLRLQEDEIEIEFRYDDDEEDEDFDSFDLDL